MVEVWKPPSSSYAELIDVWRDRCPELDEFSARTLELPHLWRQFHVRAVTDGDGLAGWGFAGDPTFAPGGWWMVHVVTAPRAARQGVASAIYRTLRGIEPDGTVRVIAHVADTDDVAFEVATHWGFVQHMHAINFVLDLVDLPTPVMPTDVSIDDVPLLDVPDPEAVDAMLHASQTNPEAAMAGPMDLAHQQGEAAGFDIPTAHVLRVDGEPAGVCQGEITDSVLQILYTGIDPAHRGRGLARVLKQHAHRYGANLGATVCQTNNEASNAGILHVNESLGFRRVNGTRRLGLDL